MNIKYTPEMNRTILEHIDLGRSMSEIARIMTRKYGFYFTKNMIIGKYNRIKNSAIREIVRNNPVVKLVSYDDFIKMLHE